MLRSEPLDLLSVATPQPLHAEMTIQAAAYRPRAILCEKPWRPAWGRRARCWRPAFETAVRLAIGHEWRWMDIHVKARSLIADGAIGEPLSRTLAWIQADS